MLSNILDRISFVALSVVIVLLPLFFLPFTKIPVETSKSLLLVIGLAISVIFWAAARFSDGKILIPKSTILLGGFGIIFAVLLSSILSSPSTVSFFGIMFDIGTFWFIFSAFVLMLFSSIIINDSKKAMFIISSLSLSFGLVLFFQLLRFFMPATLSLGVLGSSTDSLLGNLNNLAILAGLSGLMCLFVLEFFKVSKVFKWILGILLVLALFIVAATNFSLVWELFGLFALIIFVYKISLGGGKDLENKSKNFPAFSFGVVMLSLLFFMSGQFIGGFLPNRLGISNIEIRPSAQATMIVAKSSLSKDLIFGIGPNRFSEIWSSYKPAVINSTRFWNTSFNNGSGFLPTMAVTTGVLGMLALITFLFIFIASGLKMLFVHIKKGISGEIALFFFGAMYLFIASFFYSVGLTAIMLAFAFVGIFIGLSTTAGTNKVWSFSFLSEPRKSFFSILFLILLMIISAGISFKFIERFASVAYLGKVFTATDMPKAEFAINRALLLNANDLYFRTGTQVYATKVNTLLNKGEVLTEQEKVDLQNSFDIALNSAGQAVVYNPNNYLNYESLGSLYQLATTIGVEGASVKAIEAYTKALELNPLNPGLKLAIGRLYLAEGKITDAKMYIEESLTLKPDYIDALIISSQVERSEGNTSKAISLAEQALSLSPTDQNLVQYLNTLKGINAPQPSPVEENIEETTTE